MLSGNESRVCLLGNLFLELLVALEELKLTFALNLLMLRTMLLSALGSASSVELLFFLSSWACRDRFIALSLFARRYSWMIKTIAYVEGHHHHHHYHHHHHHHRHHHHHQQQLYLSIGHVRYDMEVWAIAGARTPGRLVEVVA